MLWSKSLRENICGNFYSRKRILRIAGKIANTQKLELAKNFVPHQPRPQGFSLRKGKKPWGRGWCHTVSLSLPRRRF